MRTGHATLHRFQGAFDLRQHAAVDGAVGNKIVDLLGGEAGEHLTLLVHQAGDVGQQHQFLGLQRLSHLASDQVGVDVVGLTARAYADGRDDRDEVALDQHVQQVSVDPGDLADMADVDDFRLGHLWRLAADRELLGADQAGILTGQADSAAAMLVDQVDDALVDLAAEHHFHHVHGGGVSDPHAVDEVALDGQALE